MANNTTQKQAARQFVQDWSGKGYEKGETARFWIALLQNVYGIQDATKFMEFELPVKTILKEKGADFIDGYIPTTKVLIEQKGSKVDLTAKYRQSDGSELTPYQQARRYAAGLPVSMAPRWIVACNFTTFEVHDMERPNDAPEVIELKDLEKEYHRLSFLVDDSNVHLKKELEVSIQAGEIVGVLYDRIQLFFGSHACNVTLFIPRIDHILQRRDAHHEKLVKVGSSNAQEFQALKKRIVLISGLTQAPAVKLKPAKFTVMIILGICILFSLVCHDSLLYISRLANAYFYHIICL